MSESKLQQELTKEEQDFCVAMGFMLGFDRDVPGQHQYRHICWPFELFWGALCGSDKVWGQAYYEDATSVLTDCASCFAQLTKIRTMDPVLLAAIGGLARKTRLLKDVESAVHDYLYFSLHPERAVPLHTTTEVQLERLNQAMLAREADWSRTVEARGNAPILTLDGWKLPET